MIQKTITPMEPPVILDNNIAEKLQSLASAAMKTAPDVADRLFIEIDRAQILSAQEMPCNVVNIGSIVTFRDNASQRVRTIQLVFPHDANISEQRVSVLTPIGAALIGLGENSSISWETRSGEIRELTVIKTEIPH